jgi:hypothetical protein
MSDNEPVRRSITATLNEICAAEKSLKEQGIDVRDPDEWQELGEIVARIERKLMANRKENAA